VYQAGSVIIVDPEPDFICLPCNGKIEKVIVSPGLLGQCHPGGGYRGLIIEKCCAGVSPVKDCKKE